MTADRLALDDEWFAVMFRLLDAGEPPKAVAVAAGVKRQYVVRKYKERNARLAGLN